MLHEALSQPTFELAHEGPVLVAVADHDVFVARARVSLQLRLRLRSLRSRLLSRRRALIGWLWRLTPPP